MLYLLTDVSLNAYTVSRNPLHRGIIIVIFLIMNFECKIYHSSTSESIYELKLFTIHTFAVLKNLTTISHLKQKNKPAQQSVAILAKAKVSDLAKGGTRGIYIEKSHILTILYIEG